jgi:putative transposase
MMKNHCLARAIGDVGWGMFTGFLEYKAARAGKGFIKVNRFFPSSKTCSCCMHAQATMPLDVRTWKCDKCGMHHDRDVNAAKNIRHEAQKMIAAGIAGTAYGGSVRQGRGRKSSVLAGAVEVGNTCL